MVLRRRAPVCPRRPAPATPSSPRRTLPPCPPAGPAGPLPHQQYADLYREAGSDGVGAMGSEPACSLVTFALAEGAAGAAGAAQPGQRPLLRPAHTLSCQPHKLLTCHLQPPFFGAQEPPTPDTHLPEGSRAAGSCAPAAGQQQAGAPAASPGPALLLGLTDDVDCAVVAVTCCSGSDADGCDDAATGQGTAAAAGFVVQHVASIPAMAYVAAGAEVAAFVGSMIVRYMPAAGFGGGQGGRPPLAATAGPPPALPAPCAHRPIAVNIARPLAGFFAPSIIPLPPPVVPPP